MSKTTLAYKAFDKDLKCRGFQFEIGKTYEHEGTVEICKSGFHACENPLDVWSYYDITDCRFALVELSGKQDTHDQDSKIAAAKIEIKAELSLGEFLPKAIQWLIDACKPNTDGDNVQAASGYSSQLAASGDYSQLAASGYSSQLAASGDYSQLAASGDYSQLAASGDYSQLAASGDYSKLAASGYSSKLAASGDSSKLAASGDSSQLAASGKDSVIASSGYNAIAKGIDGTWISLAEFDSNGKCIGFATGCIGKNGLKADTYYRAKGGKLVEATA